MKSSSSAFLFNSIFSAYRFMLLAFCFAISLKVSAQNPTPDDPTEEKIERIAEEAGEEVDMNTLLDKLLYYREHKIDLNNTNREELKELMILNDIQIEAIFHHLTEEGKFISLTELQTIDELDQ